MPITRRHLSLAAGMAAAVILTAGALIASTTRPLPGADLSASATLHTARETAAAVAD